MVAQLLQLRVTLLGNSLARRRTVFVGACLFVAAATALLSVWATNMTVSGPEARAVLRDAVVIGGAVISVAFFAVPFIAGVRQAVSVRALDFLGISRAQISWGLPLATVLSVPVIALGLLMLASIAVWSVDAVSFLASIASMVLVIASCVLVFCISTLTVTMMSSRRATDRGATVGFLALLATIPLVFFGIFDVMGALSGTVRDNAVAQVVAWTPAGAMWAIPGHVSLGDYGSAAIAAVVALAWVGALWAMWRGLLRWSQNAAKPQWGTREYDGLGLFRFFPAKPLGVIAARSLKLWVRDPRFLANLATVPFVALAGLPFTLAGMPMNWLALVSVPIMCLFLGFTLHNVVAYDYTAIWLDVVSGIDGLADRLGRLMPVIFLGIPLVVGGAILGTFFYGDWLVLPAVIGVSASLLLSSAGLSSFVSVQFPYASPRPGDTPFAQPVTASRGALLTQGLVLLGALASASPAVALAWLGFTVNPAFFIASLWAGGSVGIVVLALGVASGAYVYARRGPEMMAAALRG